MVFTQIYKSIFPLCLTIICMPIPTVFFSSFLTWEFHNHFIQIKYTIGGPIGKNIVCSCLLSCFSPYNNNSPYLWFPFVNKWYTYSRSFIWCGSYFFTIVGGIFNIRTFNATSEMCNLVSTKVGPFYITSSWLSYFILRFLYFGCTNQIQIIRGIICGKSSSWRSKDDI
jgi:hypothetical protein